MSRASALVWPKRERWSGVTYWLSSGQRSLLFWIEARIAKGHHEFTIDQAAAAVGLDRSNISRGLDRLASLSLIGRHSRPGRGRRTRVWRIGRTRVLAERARPQATGNVATSTPYGGYLSREGLSVGSGAVRSGREAARRLAPPRLVYDRCPAGHRVRLARWLARTSPDGSRLDGSWKGWCRRCGAPHAVRLSLELRTDPRESLSDRRRSRVVALAEGRIDRDTFREAEAADQERARIASAGRVADGLGPVVDSRAAPGSRRSRAAGPGAQPDRRS